LSESTTGTTPSNGSCYESAREPLTLQAKWGNGLSANWHVRPKDRARLRAELAALDARLHELDHRRRKAINRQRYSRSPKDVSAAADDLKNLIAEMDGVMTRSRAIEGKLLLLQKPAQKSVDCGRDPNVVSGDVSERIVVEVSRDPSGTKMNG
jgi:hypothetical protein